MVKTLFLQTERAAELRQTAESQKVYAKATTPFRGLIVDRFDEQLAIDTARYDVYLRPVEYKAKTNPAKNKEKELGELLGMSIDNFRRTLAKGKTARLAQGISRAKADSLAKLAVPGLDLMPQNYREYPHKELAANLLGFVSWDKTGQSGMEQALNEELNLSPEEQKPVISRIDGRPVTRLVPIKPLINSSFGNKVVLTIDSKLQYKAEAALRKGIEKSGGKQGAAIVLHSKTGEVLAWASYPFFDPNNYSSYSADSLGNWSALQAYEPGSTFKILTIAAALDQKAIDPSFRCLDPGRLQIGNQTIRNHGEYRGGPREIGLRELFSLSSNVASSLVALKIPAQGFYGELRDFGIGSKTGVGLPGESAGHLKGLPWSGVEQATTGFGQGVVAVTAIQMAAAVNAIANDGQWVQPHILKKIVSADGRRELKKTEALVHPVVSPEVARIVRELLRDSVQENLINDPSYFPGRGLSLDLAGKTGTAQKYCPELRGYCLDATVASFIGFFPSVKPEFLVYVVIDSPSELGGWGNTVAGPVFNEIASGISYLYPKGLKVEESGWWPKLTP